MNEADTTTALQAVIRAQAYSAFQSANLVREKYPDGREFWTLTAWVEPRWEDKCAT